MADRSFVWPEGHWDWPEHLAYRHGVRCGEMIFVGGQVDKDAAGERLNTYNLAAQTAAVVGHIDTVLEGFGAGLGDVTKLVAFYANDGGVDERAFLADVGRHVIALGGAPGGVGPAITAVPLPWLAYPEMAVEIEAIAMLGADGAHLERCAANPSILAPLPAPFSQGLRCGEHIWVSGQSARTPDGAIEHADDILAQTPMAMAGIAHVLDEFGAGFDDAIKFNIWSKGDGTRATWQDAAVLRASHFTEPGPGATALPTPSLPAGEMTRMELWAMRGADGAYIPRAHAWPEGSWDWPVPMPYKMGVKCRDIVVVGGQVALDRHGAVLLPGDLVGQTKRTMDYIRGVLAEFGLGFDDMVKQNGFYAGVAGREVIVPNQVLRSSYYTEPAGAATGVPLPYLALEGLMTEIEIIAMPR